MPEVEPAATEILPATRVEVLLPVERSYVTELSAPLVFMARASVPVWLMLLFDLNRMLPPLALSVIVPAW